MRLSLIAATACLALCISAPAFAFDSIAISGEAKGVDSAGFFGAPGGDIDSAFTLTAAQEPSTDDPTFPGEVIFNFTVMGHTFTDFFYDGYVNLAKSPIAELRDSVSVDNPIESEIYNLTGPYYGFYSTSIGETHGGATDYFDLYAAPTSPAPEPATWGLMLAGVGLAGLALRSRKLGGTVSA